jgi:manganese transport protein
VIEVLKKIISTLSVIGPAVLVSIELFDPASIVTATASGASQGFLVLWAAFYSGLLLILIQEISARLGVVTGKTLAENIYQNYGKSYAFLLFIITIFLDLATLTAEVMGLSLAISFIFKIPYLLGILASILITTFLVYYSPYDKLERVIMFLVTMIFLSYLYFFFTLNIPIKEVMFYSLVPTFDPGSFYYAEAIIGASIMPTYIILHSGLVCEKGWAHHHEVGIEDLVEHKEKSIKKERIDSVFSLLMGTVLNIAIIAIAAVLLKGKEVKSFLDIAFPFYDELGNIGLKIFALAFICSGIAAILTVGLSSVYNAFGFLGFEERINKRKFKLSFILWVVIAGVISLLPNQIEIIVFTQYLNGVLLPFIIIPLILLTKNKKIMGKYKLGKTITIIALTTVMITTLLFIINVISLVIH